MSDAANRPTVYATDVRRGPEGEWLDIWECPPPDAFQPFRVVDCSWNAQMTERRIRRIVLGRTVVVEP